MTLTGQAYRVIFKELKEQQESEFEQAFKKGIAKIQQNQTQESILVSLLNNVLIYLFGATTAKGVVTSYQAKIKGGIHKQQSTFKEEEGC
ncbi:TPA: hypothetical protein PW951_000174 [Mannheimia haemolytica]|nr:hypothetical protein [Mannheimia haemolytica]